MPNLVPYIFFAQNSREAVTFYQEVFGGDAEVQVDGDRVVHLDFHSGDVHFMGSDGEDGPAGPSGNSVALVLNCDSEEQLRELFEKLVDGGEEVFAPVDGGWGAVVAHCVDRFGVTWMLNYDTPPA